MIARFFFIALSIALSGQGLEGCVEENTIEKTQGVEVAYEELISSETKKQSRKLACQHSAVFLSKGRKSLQPVKEKAISQTSLYLQNRSIRI